MEIEWVTDGQTNNQIICLWLLISENWIEKFWRETTTTLFLIWLRPGTLAIQHTRATSRTGGRRLDFKNNTRDIVRERPPTLYLHTLLASCSNSNESQCKKTHKNKKDISTNLAFFDTILNSRSSQRNFSNPLFGLTMFKHALTITDPPPPKHIIE